MKLNGNLTFLGGGVAENLRIEALTNDPALPLDQQIWVNTTDSKIRAKVGGVVTTLADDATVQEILGEVSNVETAVGLDTDGNFIAFTGTNYLNSATSIVTSLTALDTQAKSNADAVAAETTRATAAEGSLQSELNATQTGAGLNADGSLATFTGANYIAASTSLRAAAVALDTQVKANAVAIAAETTRATAAEGSITSALNAEVTRATAAEGTLTTNLNAEVTRATAAEGALDTRLSTVEGSYINKDGSVAMTGDLNVNSNSITNVADPVAAGDAVNKSYVDNKVAAIGSVFAYVGAVEGGIDAAGATDLALLTQKDAGDYYKVTTGGYFKLGEGAAFFANVNDGLIFNLTAGVDVIDNTNSQVQGTTNFVAVSGNSDTGFVVDIAGNFKTRVSTLETDLAAEVTRATAAEGTLQSNIDAEVTRATAAETTLQNNINAEVTRATAAEGSLQTEINAVETAVGLAAAGTFVALTGTNYLNSATTVVGLSQALDTAVKALTDRYAASFAVYNGSTPATSHTFTHNLGTQFVNVTVVDTNNQVIIPQSITFDSTNALTVVFNSSIACKIVVSGLKA